MNQSRYKNLVAALSAGTSHQARAVIPINPYKELRYLVIDDQEKARSVLRSCIQGFGGFEIEQAQSYADAIFKIKRNVPDIIVCDYILGSGRTGQQLLEELRRNKLIPDSTGFLMVTAENTYEQVVAAVELAPDDYIIKPFSPDLLKTRLERLARKKYFFHRFFSFKAAESYESAFMELESLTQKRESQAYRFDILRNGANLAIDARMPDEAAERFDQILEIHPFPWAKVGKARAMHQKQDFSKARDLLASAIESAPHYFEAYDLKAEVCIAQGDFSEAQKTLAEVSAKTPRNFMRKRSLAKAATMNGDMETACSLMKEIAKKDEVNGMSPADIMHACRIALEQGDTEFAGSLSANLAKLPAFEVSDEERLSIQCLKCALPGAAAGEYKALRESVTIPMPSHEVGIDMVRAALANDDQDFACEVAMWLLTDKGAKAPFKWLLEIYRKQGAENVLRKIQQNAAKSLISRRTQLAA